MKFDWDGEKAKSNIAKHNVSFAEAETMFEPSKPAVFDDLRNSENEDRFIAIGFSDKGRMLSVSFAREGEESIRIISARKATKLEIKLYAKFKPEQNENAS